MTGARVPGAAGNGSVHADPGTKAPPRFLPQYDNIALSHADRTRIMLRNPYAELPLPGSGSNRGFFLHDGFVHGLWRIRATRGAAVLHVQPYAPLDAGAREAVAAEGARLLAFTVPEAAAREVRFAG
ncbi:crosslink repair DNA glycosylase YcaQ family protein [Streptomyces sp. PA03-1a]|nr:crosslink repair DNA glycosylase YcaQ family protein [Streptomyces sp. PA03-1a]